MKKEMARKIKNPAEVAKIKPQEEFLRWASGNKSEAPKYKKKPAKKESMKARQNSGIGANFEKNIPAKVIIELAASHEKILFLSRRFFSSRTVVLSPSEILWKMTADPMAIPKA